MAQTTASNVIESVYGLPEGTIALVGGGVAAAMVLLADLEVRVELRHPGDVATVAEWGHAG